MGAASQELDRVGSHLALSGVNFFVVSSKARMNKLSANGKPTGGGQRRGIAELGLQRLLTAKFGRLPRAVVAWQNIIEKLGVTVTCFTVKCLPFAPFARV